MEGIDSSDSNHAINCQVLTLSVTKQKLKSPEREELATSYSMAQRNIVDDVDVSKITDIPQAIEQAKLDGKNFKAQIDKVKTANNDAKCK
jgi:CTP synthase (UTP-ammonia lyase)